MRSFGRKDVLKGISLTIEPGVVYGLVGENGVGKTTLIQHLLGLLKAQRGSVWVFGFDPVTHPVDILGRIGYLSENRDLPEFMKINEFMTSTRPSILIGTTSLRANSPLRSI